MTYVSGLDSTREVMCVSVAEVTFMLPDPGGTPYFRSDMGDGTGTGFTEPENWSEHVPDGTVEPEGRALVGKEGRISRPFSPRYMLLPHIWRNVAGLPDSFTTVDGGTREKYVFTHPGKEAPAIETNTFYWGLEESAYRLTGGKVINFNIDVRRNADGGAVTGTIEYHFQRVSRNVPIPAAVAQNEIKAITATNATGNGAFTLPATTLGLGGSLTVEPGDTATELQTKIRAIAGYNDAGVTVAGSSNDLAAGTQEVQTIVLTDVPPGSVVLSLAGQQVSFPAQGTNADVKAAIESFPNIGAGKVVSVTGSLTEDYDGNFSGTYTVTFSATLGNVGQVTSPTSGVATATTTPGVAATLSNGTYLVTFAGALAQTNIADWPGTGGNGWTSTTNQQGTAGSGIVYVEGPYLEPDTVSYFIATDLADAATIDYTDVPNELTGAEGDSHGLWTSPNSSFSMADLWKPYYAAQKKRYAMDFVPGARTVTANVEMPNTMEPGSDAEFLVTTADHCIATGFYFIRHWKCDDYEYVEKIFVTRNEAPTHGGDNDVWLKSFGLARARNPEGPSVQVEIYLPV